MDGLEKKDCMNQPDIVTLTYTLKNVIKGVTETGRTGTSEYQHQMLLESNVIEYKHISLFLAANCVAKRQKGTNRHNHKLEESKDHNLSLFKSIDEIYIYIYGFNKCLSH